MFTSKKCQKAQKEDEVVEGGQEKVKTDSTVLGEGRKEGVAQEEQPGKREKEQENSASGPWGENCESSREFFGPRERVDCEVQGDPD